MPKINGNEIRPGNGLEPNGGLWAAVQVGHVQHGKGGACAQTALRNQPHGPTLHERRRPPDKCDRVPRQHS